jgi:hypothetical protein
MVMVSHEEHVMAVSDAAHYGHDESRGTRDGLREDQRLTRHGDKSFIWHKILILHDDVHAC